MKRMNIWVIGSVIGAFIAGSFIGWMVTRLGCAEGSCATSAILIGLVSGFVAAVGVGIVVVLADLSLREWRAAQQSGGPMPEPGRETDDADES